MRGLPNDGARCWFNAGVQALLHCPPLANYAFSDEFAGDLYARRSNACAIARAFADLARAYWRGADAPGGADADVGAAAGRLFDALRKVHPRLARGQQDAHEGLVLLTGALHDATSGPRARRMPASESATSASPGCDVGAWGGAGGAYGFLSEVFMGQSRLSDEGSPAAERLDHWWCLSLAVGADTSLSAALARHHGARGHVTHAPPCLVVHLKRFDASAAKIDKFVSYGADLALPLSAEAPPARYALFAVVMHAGESGGGHYTCLAEHRGAWDFADDGAVTRITDINNIVNRDAYVLMYKRRPA